MLNVKKTLTKIMDALLKVQTETVSGTTNGSGAISLASKIPITAEVLSVRTTSNANYMCIPWVYNNAVWYCKVVDWSNLAAYANKSVSLTIKYINP